MQAAFPDHFSDGADRYAQARPTYPDELFRFLASEAPAPGRVWDCATGNGQAARGLARHFAAVEASDASAQQIAEAPAIPRVRYSVQPAEHTDFADASFDAVCVAQALHWFDFDRFFPEVQRVLRPGGLFAAWAYDWMFVSAEFDALFRALVLDVLTPDWAPQNQLAWDDYRDVPFPFTLITPPSVSIQVRWTFPQLVDYVGTWSATRRRVRERGAAFLEDAMGPLTAAWGKPDDPRVVSMRLVVRVGRHAAMGEKGAGSPS